MKKKKMKPIRIAIMGFELERDLKYLTKKMSESNKDAQALLKKIHKLQEEVQEESDKAEVKRLRKRVGFKK